MSERKVRVRFAPSPTGPLHIGGVRTALYNYLFARQHGGDLVFRIEDTDSARFVPGAEDYIIESFKWLGIQFDEGVSFGGDKGPYRQSERREIYKKYVDQLLAEDKAYIAFDSPEDLNAAREATANFQYDASTRGNMCNSLTLSAEEVEQRISRGDQYVVRFKIQPGEDVHVDDLIRGDVVINSTILDDKVLYKSADQLPTYHLANIVDDHLMEISHVIRGEEWLPSAPLHVLLYRAFGWEDTMPRFAHLPLLLKPTGNGKLSKRDGDKLGFPVFPLEWHAADGPGRPGFVESKHRHQRGRNGTCSISATAPPGSAHVSPCATHVARCCSRITVSPTLFTEYSSNPAAPYRPHLGPMGVSTQPSPSPRTTPPRTRKPFGFAYPLSFKQIPIQTVEAQVVSTDRMTPPHPVTQDQWLDQVTRRRTIARRLWYGYVRYPRRWAKQFIRFLLTTPGKMTTMVVLLSVIITSAGWSMSTMAAERRASFDTLINNTEPVNYVAQSLYANLSAGGVAS